MRARLPGPQAGAAGQPAGAGDPLEGRYLARTVTGSLRLGVGSPTILDALALVHTGTRANRPVLERAYNICSDLGLVAATLVHGGLAEVEAMKVRPGNPVRPLLAQRMSEATTVQEVLDLYHAARPTPAGP